jgi:hypothetical protein
MRSTNNPSKADLLNWFGLVDRINNSTWGRSNLLGSYFYADEVRAEFQKTLGQINDYMQWDNVDRRKNTPLPDIIQNRIDIIRRAAEGEIPADIAVTIVRMWDDMDQLTNSLEDHDAIVCSEIINDDEGYRIVYKMRWPMRKALHMLMEQFPGGDGSWELTIDTLPEIWQGFYRKNFIGNTPIVTVGETRPRPSYD